MQRLRATLNARRGVGSVVCGTAVSWFVACGGNATIDGPNGNRAGASNVAGGSNVAGASNLAGAINMAGASPVAGSAGSGPDEACTASRASGQCDAYFPSFWHDPKTGLCEPFAYGGCGGNANRYESRNACIEACPNAAGAWDACLNDSQCTLLGGTGCCALCEPTDDRQFLAINRENAALYLNSRCANAGACLPCPPVPEQQQLGKFFKPVCQNSRCTAIDIRESSLIECQETSDCVLRNGAECCPQCDESGWVALSKTANLCAGADVECDACASAPPPNLELECFGGRCRLKGE